MGDQKKELALEACDWVVANLEMGHEDEVFGMQYEPWLQDLEGQGKGLVLRVWREGTRGAIGWK